MGSMLLALAVLAGDYAFLAVALCMIVLATSEAHRGCAYIVGQPISYACSVPMLRLDSIVWHHVVTWGGVWWRSLLNFTPH